MHPEITKAINTFETANTNAMRLMNNQWFYVEDMYSVERAERFNREYKRYRDCYYGSSVLPRTEWRKHDFEIQPDDLRCATCQQAQNDPIHAN